MFSLLDGRKNLYQWDLDRIVVLTDIIAKEVHFSNKTMSHALVCYTYEENGKLLCPIPDIILQQPYDLKVYAYDDDYTLQSTIFEVQKRPRPEDYVCTDKEYLKVRDIVIDELEKASESGQFNGITPHIGENGNWYIGEEDTGVNAKGAVAINFAGEPMVETNGVFSIDQTAAREALGIIVPEQENENVTIATEQYVNNISEQLKKYVDEQVVTGGTGNMDYGEV